jgi:hypothetical protein
MTRTPPRRKETSPRRKRKRRQNPKSKGKGTKGTEPVEVEVQYLRRDKVQHLVFLVFLRCLVNIIFLGDNIVYY